MSAGWSFAVVGLLAGVTATGPAQRQSFPNGLVVWTQHTEGEAVELTALIRAGSVLAPEERPWLAAGRRCSRLRESAELSVAHILGRAQLGVGD